MEETPYSDSDSDVLNDTILYKYFKVRERMYKDSIFPTKKSLILHASFWGEKNIVDRLLAIGTDVNITNDYGVTPLMWACFKGFFEIAVILILNGADVNLQNKNGYTALMNAVENCHIDIVQMLIENKADVNVKAKDGNSPLKIAWDKGEHVIASKLIAAGAVESE